MPALQCVIHEVLLDVGVVLEGATVMQNRRYQDMNVNKYTCFKQSYLMWVY